MISGVSPPLPGKVRVRALVQQEAGPLIVVAALIAMISAVSPLSSRFDDAGGSLSSSLGRLVAVAFCDRLDEIGRRLPPPNCAPAGL